jgi:hypothetical protein
MEHPMISPEHFVSMPEEKLSQKHRLPKRNAGHPQIPTIS